MTDPAAPPPVQLLLYEFGPEGNFQGQMVGALERLESGGALRIVDMLFVHRQADGGELDVVNLKGDGAGGIAMPLLDFRSTRAPAAAPRRRRWQAGQAACPRSCSTNWAKGSSRAAP
jgi:hypothetical protein